MPTAREDFLGASDLLEAADGLRLERAGGGSWRVAWGEPDWLGPLTLRAGGNGRADRAPALREREGSDDLGAYRAFELEWEGLDLPLRSSVRAYRELPVLVFRLEATGALHGLATGRFDEPRIAWPWIRPHARSSGGVPPGTRGFGHQYTEFAFPTLSDESLANFFLFPHRPAVVEPLWLNAPDGRSLLLAPLDAFHDQVIAVPRGAEAAELGVRCGWHGDLDAVPRGFASELALWAGSGPRAVLDAWAGALRRRHATRRPSRYANATLSRLSYWTDNGAAYWYRREPGRDMAETLEDVAQDLRERRIPVGAFELDSWFYAHERARPVAELGAEPEGPVPPSGMLRWEARPDVLPDGVRALRRRLGDPPLILHSRHFSSRSSYFTRTPAWIDRDRAHPEDPAFFATLLAQAADWGADTFEQDWLVEMFLGVRGLREQPGRARAWQRAVDRAAADHGVSLLWCMATPADFFETVSLGQVAAIRTSGDYRYLSRNPDLWVRFLYTNALARALGLHPFKDVFFANGEGEGLDGDPYAEPEALLAALSTGPVGIGDRVGRADRALVLRTCREDGVLVKPDVPLAAIDRCLRADCAFEPEPLVAECWSEQPAGRWVYVAAFHCWKEDRPLTLELPLRELGAAAPTRPVLAIDWRQSTATHLAPDAALRAELAPGDWRYWVLCPVLLDGRLVLAGDLSRYASAGDRRLRRVRESRDSLDLELLGAPGERVVLSGWCETPLSAERWGPGEDAHPVPVLRHPDSSFDVSAEIPERGWLQLRLTPGS